MDFGLKNPNIVFEVLLLVLFAQLAVTVKPGGPPYLSRCGEALIPEYLLLLANILAYKYVSIWYIV